MAYKTVVTPSRAAIEILGDDHFKDHRSGHITLSDSDLAQAAIDEAAEKERKLAREKDLAENGYKYRRAEKFKEIAIGDQLDAIWKALSKIQDIPLEAQDVLKSIQAIKDSEPKPKGIE